MGKSTKAPTSKTVSGLSFKENRLEAPFTIENWHLPMCESKIYWGAIAKREHIVCLVQDKNKDDILNNLTKYGILEFLKKELYRNFHHSCSWVLNNSSAEIICRVIVAIAITNDEMI